MDYFQGVRRQIRTYLAFIVFIENALLLTATWLASTRLRIPPTVITLGGIGLGAVMTFIVTLIATDFAIEPLKAIWQAVVRLAPGNQQQAITPDAPRLVVGKQLVATLTAQIYQIANVAEQALSEKMRQATSLRGNFIATNMPLPLFVLDANETLVFLNNAASQYIGRRPEDVTGQNIYSVLNMSFPNEQTLDEWLKKVKSSSVTASVTWERVRLNVTDNRPMRLFDLAAYYNKGNAQQFETMLIMFDHTEQYSQDDQAVSYIALSVHELRTPLTLLRGYIEAFEEEMRGKLDPQMQGFMAKMIATEQQLTAFVNNILDVARIDSDQLTLKLHEENWPEVLQTAVSMMELRAAVRGIALKLTISPNMPTAAVDSISIQEVISNLIDNAIKYSGTSKEILVNSYVNNDGLIETTVQDFGVGVPVAVMPNLFTKFYRDHRNRAQIGGTGLGLYLCKAIIGAHGGNIWVQSKEGQGSAFTFTLLPYAKLADAAKSTDNTTLIRSAHGWIKNHSLYRS